MYPMLSVFDLVKKTTLTLEQALKTVEYLVAFLQSLILFHQLTCIKKSTMRLQSKNQDLQRLIARLQPNKQELQRLDCV